MSITAREVYSKAKSAARNVAVSFDDQLEVGESIVTPTVTETTALSMSIDQEQVNSATTTVKVYSVGIGRAILFRVSGGTIGEGKIRVSGVTDGTPPQTVVSLVKLNIEEDGT